MPVLFAATVFLSAALLFLVEPLVARMILPGFGGAPAVWNTCMVFYQAALLAGYAAAHALSGRVPIRVATILQLALIALAALVLPLDVTRHPLSIHAIESRPILSVLWLLLLMVGLPFFVLSTMGPIVQNWFAGTGHAAAGDPYFLYGASNLGSMLALLSYPLVFEPLLPLARQSTVWSVGYGALFCLTIACAWARWRNAGSMKKLSRPAAVASGSRKRDRKSASKQSAKDTSPPRRLRRARWVALAFVPSSLMLGVTTYLTTDIAPIPLLWVVPLTIYLLSFILAFGRYGPRVTRLARRALPACALLVTILILCADMEPPIAVVLLVHLTTLLVAALYCHGELAGDRPAPVYLTVYYLWISLGGALGGVLNGLVAPVVFSNIVEYPIAIVLACLLLNRFPLEERLPRPLDWGLPLALGLLTALMVVLIQYAEFEPVQLRIGLMFGLPAAICYTLRSWPTRFSLALAGMLAAGIFYYVGGQGQSVYSHRSFFGVLHVMEKDGFYQLIHGNTVHGREQIKSAGPPIPLAYYHPTGPIGQLFTQLKDNLAGKNIGVIGLGIGSLAAYAEPTQDWTFFEIDPAVERLARDARFFTFLSESKAHKLDVVLGDGRLSLEQRDPQSHEPKIPDHQFQLLVVDAFSSDVIPVHLLTREALKLYISKLAPDGLLAFHISNRYLDLEPVLDNLARDSRDPKLGCWFFDDLDIGELKKQGKEPSSWAVIAPSSRLQEKLVRDGRWRPLRHSGSEPAWRDDFSNLVGTIKWN